MLELGEHVVGDLAIVGSVCTLKLDVDGRGEAEVEDLGNDVGGQEVEGDAGKVAGEPLAKLGYKIGGGSVVFFEGDHDVSVACAEEAGGGVLEVERAVGQADVVEDVVHLPGGDDGADLLLDEIAEFGGLFDAGPALGADVEDEGAVVAAGEEVLTPERARAGRCRGRRAGRMG